MELAGMLVVVDPPGTSGGLPLPVWIAVVTVILIIGIILFVRRRRQERA